MSVKDFFNSLVGRFSNPLQGNYLVALVLINWKLLLFFFAGNETVEWRIVQIESYLESRLFYFSFLYALAAFGLYTYLVPFIVTILKKLQNQVNVYVLRNELAFEARLENEKRLGGSSEVIATCLKKEIHLLNKYLKDLGDFVRVKTIPSTVGSKGESDAILKRNEEFVVKTEDILLKCKDILNTNYGKESGVLLGEFLDARKKR